MEEEVRVSSREQEESVACVSCLKISDDDDAVSLEPCHHFMCNTCFEKDTPNSCPKCNIPKLVPASDDIPTCPFCLELPIEAISLQPCNHVTCRACFEEYLTTSRKSVCPVCRGHIDQIMSRDDIKLRVKERLGVELYTSKLSVVLRTTIDRLVQSRIPDPYAVSPRQEREEAEADRFRQRLDLSVKIAEAFFLAIAFVVILIAANHNFYLVCTLGIVLVACEFYKRELARYLKPVHIYPRSRARLLPIHDPSEF